MLAKLISRQTMTNFTAKILKSVKKPKHAQYENLSVLSISKEFGTKLV